ncbi:MAG: hypothetical protein IPN29_17710 [Saprospiraceae bacterium]|nr:hypothetical protein [Saprospiraceae bacterium]
MNYRTFEKNVKSTLQDTEVYVDVGQLIADIRKTERKRRPIGWWWLSALPLLSLVAYLFFGNVPSEASHENTTASNNSFSFSTTNAYAKPANVHSVGAYNATSASPASPTWKSAKNASTTANKLKAYEKSPAHLDDSDKISTPSENKDVFIQTEMSRPLFQFPGLIREPLFPSAYFNKINLSREIECPTFRKRSSWSFTVIPEVGYFRPLKTLAQNSSEPSDVFALREKDEKSLEGIQAALYLKINKSSSPWGLKSGIQMTRLTERMNLSYSYIRRDTTQGIISVTVSQTGDTITTIYGDIISETRVTGTNKAHYSLSTIDIPLAVSYEKNFGGILFGADAGVYFNIALRSGGKILSSANGFADAKGSNAFRSSLGLSYFGSLFVKKPLGNIGSVYLAARGRYLPGSFTNSSYPISQSYHMIGLHLGYEYTF